MRYIDSSDASFGSIKELADEINFALSKTNDVQERFGITNDIFLCHYLKHHYVSSSFFKNYNSRVLIQPIDGTVVASFHVNDINKFDLIITPASVGKTIMQDCGVKRPIKVIPNYYDDLDIVKASRLLYRFVLPNADDAFIFYHESSIQPRKNTTKLAELYLKAFSDTSNANKVHLVIKGPVSNDFQELKHSIHTFRKRYSNSAKISMISANFSKTFLRKIWSTVDCYVSFAHMEGFGIPLLRMAINQKPILTLRSSISGYMDFLNDSNTYFVTSKTCPIIKEAAYIFDEEKSHWEDIAHSDEAIEIFRKILSDFSSGKLLCNKQDLSAFSKSKVMSQYRKAIADC